jgi:hypothetical protein
VWGELLGKTLMQDKVFTGFALLVSAIISTGSCYVDLKYFFVYISNI